MTSVATDTTPAVTVTGTLDVTDGTLAMDNDKNLTVGGNFTIAISFSKDGQSIDLLRKDKEKDGIYKNVKNVKSDNQVSIDFLQTLFQ